MRGSSAPAAPPGPSLSTAAGLGLTLGPQHRERAGRPAWTLVGPLDARAPARVDGAGLVTPHGVDWSIDWWIGADDRWYFPSREATVRQQRQGAGPVLTTSVRIPSGDAHHQAYGAMVEGREVTVIEIENDSPVPVALALALRPYTIGAEVDGAEAGADSDRTLSPTLDRSLDAVPGSWPRSARLAGPLLLLDGEPVLRLPRGPNQAAVTADGDLADAVAEGAEVAWPGGVATDATNAVLLYPLPHRTSLRFVIPAGVAEGPSVAGSAAASASLVGDRGRTAASVVDPAAVPEVDTVARGWQAVVDGTTRFEYPDGGVTRLLAAARARLLLATGDALLAAVQRLDPELGPVLAALAATGHGRELAAVPAALAEEFPTRLPGSPLAAAELVGAVGPVLRVADLQPGDALLEVVAQLTHLVEKGDDSAATRLAQAGLSAVARAAGDTAAADHLDRLVARGPGRRRGWGRGAKGENSSASAAAPGSAIGAQGGGDAHDRVADRAAQANDAGSWGRDSVAEAARFILDARQLLVDDGGDELLLLPTFPTAWRGGNAEVHNAPTRHGVLSYGIRWHGARPALLWQLDAPSTATGNAPVTLRCPGLDPDWHTTEARGETLLAGSADGLQAPPAPGEGFR